MTEQRNPGRRRAQVDPDRRRLLVIGGLAGVVTLIVILWLVWAPWSDTQNKSAGADPVTPQGPRTATYGADWTAVGGARYRITVTPGLRTSSLASPGGCVSAPLAGSVNVPFAIQIQNLGTSPAAVPVIEVGANLGPLGTVRPAALTLERSSRRIEVSPVAAGESCTSAAGLDPSSRSKLTGGGTDTFVGILGGVDLGPSRTAPGLVLIVRYHQEDAAAPGGSTAQEFIVPFALKAAG